MMEFMRELKDLPAPPLPEGLGERILADRAAGVRPVLPSGDAPVTVRVRPVFAAAVAAAVVALLGLEQIWSRRTDVRQPSVRSLAADPFFFPQQAFAQAPGWTPPGPKFALVSAGDGSRLREGRWRYWAQTIGLGGEIARTVTVQRSTLGGGPAWLVVNRIKGPYSWTNVDSVWMDRATLSPIRLRRHLGRTGFTTLDFGTDSLTSTLDLPSENRKERATRPLPPGPRALVLPSSSKLVYLLLGTLPLNLSWEGSFYMAPPRMIDDRLHYGSWNLRVIGEGTVSVPAGTFECWQVLLEDWGSPSHGSTWWVAKRGGWVVRMTSPTSQWPDEVLLSHEPRP